MKGLFGGGLAIDRKSDTRFGDTLHLKIMKNKRKKPTVKELSEDLQTVYKVVASHSYTIDTLRILLVNYLEMKKDTKKLAKFMEAKTEKIENENDRDAVLKEDEAAK